MGITVYSFLWGMQDLYHRPYGPYLKGSISPGLPPKPETRNPKTYPSSDSGADHALADELLLLPVCPLLTD